MHLLPATALFRRRPQGEVHGLGCLAGNRYCRRPRREHFHREGPRNGLGRKSRRVCAYVAIPAGGGTQRQDYPCDRADRSDIPLVLILAVYTDPVTFLLSEYSIYPPQATNRHLRTSD